MRRKSASSWPDNFLKDYFSEISYDEIIAHGRPIKTKRAKAAAVHYVIENNHLTDKQKTALLLRYRSGLSLAQIGTEIGTDDRSMISQRIRRAVRKLVNEDNAKILKYGIPADAAETASKTAHSYSDPDMIRDDGEVSTADASDADITDDIVIREEDAIPEQIREYRRQEKLLMAELDDVRGKIDDLEKKQLGKLFEIIEELGFTPENLIERLSR